MNGSITLKQARLNCGLSVEEAAKAVGIDKRTLQRMEIDNTRSNYMNFRKLLQLYKIGINHVFIGHVDELEGKVSVS